MTPEGAANLAKIRTTDSDPAIQTAAGAHHWRLVLLDVSGADNGDLIALGDGTRGQSELSQVPHDLILDRLFVHGEAAKGRRRGIALNSAETTITGSYVSDIKSVGRDAQAICGWNGPGPFTISNNYLEASGENILFGGADPGIPELVPEDIAITRQHALEAGCVAQRALGNQEPPRAQERAQGEDHRQRPRIQLAGGTGRVRRALHRQEPGRQLRMVRDL